MKKRKVRMRNGGGSRDIKFEMDTGKQALLETGIELCCPNGTSIFGKLQRLDVSLGNFSCVEVEDCVDGQEFTLGAYCQKLKLTRVRLYLLSKKIFSKNFLHLTRLNLNTKVNLSIILYHPHHLFHR